MSNQEYEEELRAEQGYVSLLYARLDADRERARSAYASALRGTVGTPMERDVEVRRLARELRRLDVADDGLCFGRLDTVSGERSYVGRIGISDENGEYEPLLLDWRAPAARAFYVATAATPENMRRRRQLHTRGRRVVDFTDEIFGSPGAAGRGGRGDAALLAAVNAPRGEGMRDIVATILAEQDEIIRLDHTGVLVIEGGPGTGKTVVALHRVAYLLYTQRERTERHGVLVVGPNRTFLNHIGRVLVPGRWAYRSLSVNYRTPSEIMDIAAALLAEFAPGMRRPESVRAGGVAPWAARVTEDELPVAIEEFRQAEAAREGTSVVIGPPGMAGTLTASQPKRLEFDAVLVVEPERILARGPRGTAELYVALTRATRRLGVLHRGPLPPELAGLAEAGYRRAMRLSDWSRPRP